MWSELKKRLQLRLQALWRIIRYWMQRHSIPGFEGVPIYDVLSFIRDEIRKENIIIRANAMAYSFFLALFPAIITLLTLLPYLPIDNFVMTMKESVLQYPFNQLTFLVKPTFKFLYLHYP